MTPKFDKIAAALEMHFFRSADTWDAESVLLKTKGRGRCKEDALAAMLESLSHGLRESARGLRREARAAKIGRL